MASVIEQLQNLGFNQYEAQAYVALLQKNPVNGYELAKNSGIPRPNIYMVLQKLEKRGAVLSIDSPEGTRYAPLAPQELVSRLGQQYQGTLEETACALNQITPPASQEHIFNIHGYPTLLDHAQAMIKNAQRHLLVSIWPEEARALQGPIQQAQERGVQIATLCLRGCSKPCPGCKGEVFRYPIAPFSLSRWLIIVLDYNELLAGEISQQNEALAIRTRQAMLVNLSAGYIRNSIATASILSSVGGQLNALLPPQTIASLSTLQPITAQGSWLDTMRQIIAP